LLTVGNRLKRKKVSLNLPEIVIIKHFPRTTYDSEKKEPRKKTAKNVGYEARKRCQQMKEVNLAGDETWKEQNTRVHKDKQAISAKL